MSLRSLAVLSLSVCFLLMVANTNAFRIRKRMLPRSGRSEELLPSQGRFDVRIRSDCCGFNGPCRLGLNCCEGLQLDHKSDHYRCTLAL